MKRTSLLELGVWYITWVNWIYSLLYNQIISTFFIIFLLIHTMVFIMTIFVFIFLLIVCIEIFDAKKKVSYWGSARWVQLHV